jgi:hypothetical protein
LSYSQYVHIIFLFLGQGIPFESSFHLTRLG